MVRSIMLVHGYGVRGSFWDKLRPRLQHNGVTVLTPDLEADSPQQLASQIEQLAQQHSVAGPVALVGHSLGGILCALVASRVDPLVVSHLVVIAAPYGARARSMHPLLRFLIRHRLLPPFLVRPRFFSSATRRADQKLWFKRAVAESAALQGVLFGSDWFPAESFSRPPRQRCLVIYSQADRIVDAEAVRQFGPKLDAREYVFDARRGVGHNDFAASDDIADETAAAILDFIGTAPPESVL